MPDGLIGLASDKGEIAERHVRPRIVVIELHRPMGKLRGKFPVLSGGIHPTCAETRSAKASMLCAGA